MFGKCLGNVWEIQEKIMEGFRKKEWRVD